MTLLGGLTLDRYILMYADSGVTSDSWVDKKFIGDKLSTYGNIAFATTGMASHHNQFRYFIETEAYKSNEFVLEPLKKKRQKKKEYAWDEMMLGALVTSFYTWLNMSGINSLNNDQLSSHLFATPDGLFLGVEGGAVFSSSYSHLNSGTGTVSAMTLKDFYTKLEEEETAQLSALLFSIFSSTARLVEGIEFPFKIVLIKRNQKSRDYKKSDYFSLDEPGVPNYIINNEKEIMDVLKNYKIQNSVVL